MSAKSREKAREKGQKSGKGTQPLSRFIAFVGIVTGLVVMGVKWLLQNSRNGGSEEE